MLENLETTASWELTYTFTPDDITALYEDYQDYQRRNPRREWSQFLTYGIFYIGLFTIPLLSFMVVQAAYGFGFSFLALLVSSVIWSNLYPNLWTKYSLYRFRRSMKRSIAPLGELQSSISAEGLSGRNDGMAWTLFWPQIHDIVVARRTIWFVTERHQHRGMYPIPRRVFADRDAAQAFVKQATEYWKSAVVPQLPASPDKEQG